MCIQKDIQCKKIEQFRTIFRCGIGAAGRMRKRLEMYLKDSVPQDHRIGKRNLRGRQRRAFCRRHLRPLSGWLESSLTDAWAVGLRKSRTPAGVRYNYFAW